VIHHASSQFWKAYDQLPAEVQRLADESYPLLKANPRHPSLRLKKVGKHWSVRVGIHYRALAAEVDGSLVWFWIGRHDEYDRMIGA
jgi:hypothetical protein